MTGIARERLGRRRIGGAARPLRLAAPISFGVLRIAPILPEFLTLYPDVTIDLHLSDTYVDLVGEGYDAAIRIASLPDSSLMARILAPVSRYLVAAPNYLSRYGRPSHPLRLSEHRCIAYVSTPGKTWHFSNAAGETATEWTSSGGSVHWPPGGRRPKRVEVLGDFFQRRVSGAVPS